MPRYLLLIAIFLYLPGSHASLRAEEPKSEADVINTLRESAAKAETQGIGIGSPYANQFGWQEITNWPEFAKLLRKGEGPAGRIWELLPKNIQKQLADDNLVNQIGIIDIPVAEVRGLRSDIGRYIRGMLGKFDFYTEKAFKDVVLNKNLKELIALGEERTYLQTLRLNRQLLAAAFPNIISPVPNDYHTVRVVVKAGKPIILVLTSYWACEWRVEVEKGGEVAGIILGGTEPQEVTGVKVPVLYRAGRAPNWKERTNQEVIWTCRDINDTKSFTQLVDGVKKVTGKTLTYLQDKSEAPKEGFIVKPSTK